MKETEQETGIGVRRVGLKRYRTLELFSGTKSFSNIAQKLGNSTLTIDNNCQLNPDICKNIFDIELEELPTEIDILWASPPCQGFSVATIGKNWNKDHTPKTDKARLAIKLVQKTIEIINHTKPTWWFIENPRGKLRKLPMVAGFKRHTITYCQYGDTRMKPTDIWTNAYWWKPRPMCKNGDTCHMAAPRGSKTGTQGLGNAMERGKIPEQVFKEIFSQIPKV